MDNPARGTENMGYTRPRKIRQKHNIIHVFNTTICKQANYDNHKTSSELFLKSFFFVLYL